MDNFKKDIIELIKKNNDRGFVYMEGSRNNIIIKGKFSDLDALNFITALIDERPKIRAEITRFLNSNAGRKRRLTELDF